MMNTEITTGLRQYEIGMLSTKEQSDLAERLDVEAAGIRAVHVHTRQQLDETVFVPGTDLSDQLGLYYEGRLNAQRALKLADDLEAHSRSITAKLNAQSSDTRAQIQKVTDGAAAPAQSPKPDAEPDTDDEEPDVIPYQPSADEGVPAAA